MRLIPDPFPVERAVLVVVAAFVCSLAWRLPDALRPPEPGSTVTFEFATNKGNVHVLATLGALEERTAAIKRFVDDSLAVKLAFERSP